MAKDVRYWEHPENWDGHIDFNRYSDDLKKNEKKYIIKGFNHLRRIMGEGWLKEIIETRHPFYSYLSNKAPWSQFYVAELDMNLNLLSGLPNFDGIKNGLKNKNRYDSAEAELRIASIIKSNGFDVEINPKGDSNRTPDLKILVDGQEIFIEITLMGTSEDFRRANQTFYEIHSVLLVSGITFTGKVHKALSRPHVNEIKERLKKEIEKVKKTKECVEIVEEGVLEVFIVPLKEGKVDEYKKWQKERDIIGFQGPQIKSNELKRIKASIIKKNKQLPKGKPGIVVIFNDNLIEGFHHINDYSNLVYELEETVFENENLIAGVIITGGGYFKGDQDLSKKQNYISLRKKVNEVLAVDIIMIVNKYTKFQELKLEKLLSKIFG